MAPPACARHRPTRPLLPTFHPPITAFRVPIGSSTEKDIHNCGTHNCIWLGCSPGKFFVAVIVHVVVVFVFVVVVFAVVAFVVLVPFAVVAVVSAVVFVAVVLVAGRSEEARRFNAAGAVAGFKHDLTGAARKVHVLVVTATDEYEAFSYEFASPYHQRLKLGDDAVELVSGSMGVISVPDAAEPDTLLRVVAKKCFFDFKLTFLRQIGKH
eukprot:1985395-Pyramimonas_sp.AAC.1